MATKQNRPASGTKTRQLAAEHKVKTLQKELARLKHGETCARGQWTRAYQIYLRATTAILATADRSVLKGKQATKRQQDRYTKQKTLMEQWPERSIELTKKRDAWREKMARTEAALNQAKTALAVILAEDAAEAKATDEIVGQVFALNDAVVEALHRRNDFLSKHVFPHLFDHKGNLRRQVTFTSTDGLRRVVALVNSITSIDAALAERARAEIDQFFGRFEPALIDPEVKQLYEITEKLLVQKTSFQVGPDLHRFLLMPFDSEIFPELVRAQQFLKQSMRSEKTDSYIRLLTRKSRSDNWEPLRQS